MARHHPQHKPGSEALNIGHLHLESTMRHVIEALTYGALFGLLLIGMAAPLFVLALIIRLVEKVL